MRLDRHNALRWEGFLHCLVKPHSHLRQRLRLRQIVTLYYHRQFDANAKIGFYAHSLR